MLKEGIDKGGKSESFIHKVKFAKTKPLDTGNSKITASIGVYGQIIGIGYPFPKAPTGFMQLTPVGPFAGDHYSKEDVLRYRETFLQEKFSLIGYGLHFPSPISSSKVSMINHMIPRVILKIPRLKIESLTIAPIIKGRSEKAILQSYSITSTDKNPLAMPTSIGGRFYFNKPAISEITEAGIIAYTSHKNKIYLNEDDAIICENPEIGAKMFIKPQFPFPWIEIDKPITATHIANYFAKFLLKLPPKETEEIRIIYSPEEEVLQEISKIPTEKILGETANYWNELLEIEPEIVKDNDLSKLDIQIVKRNLAYTVGCCYYEENDTATMLADHVILPASWNRDAFYMAIAMLEYSARYKKSRKIIREFVRKYLNWLFKKAQKIDGSWARSHLISGEVKDDVFQLDQQLYPLLLAVLYCKVMMNNFLLEVYLENIKKAIDVVEGYKHHKFPLYRTEETPADDLVSYPYHFSSQVIAWTTFFNLGDHLKDIEPKLATFCEKRASEIKEAVMKHMVVSHPELEKEVYVYTTDLAGNYEFLHDANDIPTILAPYFEFCDRNDLVWKNTVEFAFSKDNPAYYPGSFGGLGSHHAPAKWTLGDIQELLAYNLLGPPRKVEKIRKKLRQDIMVDGLFPETIDPEIGILSTRAWFAWPGAVFAWALTSWRFAQVGYY
ncbi:MAG: glycoside hydrolase family 125 protein [Asgard group archaeon]